MKIMLRNIFQTLYLVALIFTILSATIVVLGQLVSVFLLNQGLVAFFEDKLIFCTRAGAVVSICTFVLAYLNGWMSPKKK